VADQLLITAVLIGMLVLFVRSKIRPDAVALLGLMACYLLGLLTVRETFDGFSSRAVLTVAAVLVIGRVMEVTGAAAGFARLVVPRTRMVSLRFGAIMLAAAILSAFINNIAALVIMMPAAITVAREHRLPPSALLMALAFATVLGGMTTLIGTPGNLILSSVREDTIGVPYRLFDMTYVGGMVAGAGLVYLLFIGWRLTPRRESAEALAAEPVRVFELAVPESALELTASDLRRRLRAAGGVMLATFRGGARVKFLPGTRIAPGDRVLVMSKALPWRVAAASRTVYDGAADRAASSVKDTVFARVTVSHESKLVGEGYDAVRMLSRDQIYVAAVGPRPARLKQPLHSLHIQPGDQLFLCGPAAALRLFVHEMRLLEIDHEELGSESPRPALIGLGIYAAAVIATGVLALPVSIVMVAAALAMCLLRLVPGNEIYRSIDWQVIVLLAAMIPIGRAFHDTGATDSVAAALGWALGDASFPMAVAVLCMASMLLSSFLNNVATTLVMGQVAVETAQELSLNLDAALLAVLVGSSCSFLTPIAHQNNLLVMRPGGYLFADYLRVGLPLTAIVIATTAYVLTTQYG
jgi:di/tricarboxylate transporter